MAGFRNYEKGLYKQLEEALNDNKTHTRLWIHQHKSQEALKETGFLSNYTGDNCKRWY